MRILARCLPFLAAAFCSHSHAWAGSTEHAAPVPGRLQLRVGGGWSLYRMGELNEDYFDGWAATFGWHDDGISDGVNVCGQLDYLLTPKLSVGIGVTYLYARVSDQSEEPLTDEQGNLSGYYLWKRSFSTALIAPELKLTYSLRRGRLDPMLTLGATWCFGTATSRPGWPERGWPDQQRWDASGWGVMGSAGASYGLARLLSVQTEIGYRLYVTGSLEGDDGREFVLRQGGDPISLDFSGPFVLGSVCFRP